MRAEVQDLSSKVADLERSETEDAHPDFTWNGLMGYTPNGVRVIGPDPNNPHLIYNFGCNGIGILPSIYGGKRVVQIINGEMLPPSTFDPMLHPMTSLKLLL